MKLHVLSDLHAQFTEYKPNVEAVDAADVIVLAGDFHQGAKVITWARTNFPDRPIIYVAGNHEFYGHHWEKAGEYGIHFLENDAVTFENARFDPKLTVEV